MRLLLDTQCWLWWFSQPEKLVATLPLHHRDPFDRILIAQAQMEKMTLVSADSTFNLYEVSLLWAAT